MNTSHQEARGPLDIEGLKAQVERPSRAVVTAGMPYANGPLHLGHLAGAQIPADVYARWLRMLIGAENVLYVCGTDDHGSTSELAAMQAGKTIQEFIGSIREKQRDTLQRYSIAMDIYTGTSHPDCFPIHKETAQDFLRRLDKNGMLNKKVSRQWFDTKLDRFLQDRFVRGQCPNPKCDNKDAYSDECDRCGAHYDPTELQNPRSALSDATPELRDTLHWWLDMWRVSEQLRIWVQGKEKKWRKAVFTEVIETVLPSLRFDNTFEAQYKEIKATLPKHKSKYAAGKKVALTFENKQDLATGQAELNRNKIPSELIDGWAHRSITRDVTWGIPLPPEMGAETKGKTLYVWPDSLIAPISFSKVALKAKGKDPELYKEFWRDPKARVYQFLGQDNVFFYTIMQGALWLGTQDNPERLPKEGDYQLTEIFSVYHLMIDGEKMSKSRGNFYSGDQLLDEKGFHPDQVRYFLALLSLPEKSSNFDFETFKDRNRFLAGPMNAAFEKPIAAAHSKFDGKVPDGQLMEKVQQETTQIIKRYLRSMERAEYSTLLFAIENYARQINSLFTQFKPHDDRQPEDSRRDALFSCFYVLKNIMIMLYPFVPDTMNKVRESLRLSPDAFTIEELGRPIPAGHAIGEKQQFFPAAE
ncbi:MAG TPA: class I tRNA ligase family protein [Oligoflexus sp.]|uniref:methionine--tRNA ligase n=1 Tax=Oligoflexus sp. TaxID=1971216 RepID=UPI002D7F7323|nr:class I tRNA ligase family protein [Oligoflexus sp.]HET9239863.1 class I tRNA ligase family protein [Oligoflexus sp.]